MSSKSSNPNVVTTTEVRTRSCQVQEALRIEVLIFNPLKYAPSERVCSQPVSNGDGFKARLIIVPHLPELVAVLHLAPPERWTSQWNCSNLRVTVSISKAKDPEWKISRSRVEQVCKERPVTGVFRGLLKCTEMTEELGWLDEKGHLQVSAEISGLPSFAPRIDFSQELHVVTFLLRNQKRLYFDRRVLMGQSEYFREMLRTATWQESATGEIDLTNDPQCTIESVSALLDYMITKNFHCCGDQDLAFVVRMLADRYQLPHLVEEVDSQLENMLCKENVLSFFGRLLGTNSMLEAKCMKMLEVDGQRILEEHEATLDQITEENPSLAKKLIQVLIQRGKKRSREERSDASNSSK